MKKMLKAAIAAVFTLSTLLSSMVIPQTVSAEAPVSSAQLITQGDFESFAAETVITRNTPGTTDTFFAPVTTGTIVDTEAASGTKSLLLQGDEGQNPRVNIRETLKGGVTYRISVKVKAGSDTAIDPYLRVQEVSTPLNPAFGWEDRDRVNNIVSSSGWKSLCIYYTPVADNTVQFNICNGQNGSSMYIDDFECVDASEYAYAKVSESFDSFETGYTLPNGNGTDASHYFHASTNSVDTVVDTVYRGESGKSVKVECKATSMNTIRLGNIKVVPGRQYLISAYVKTDGTNKGGLSATLVAQGFGGNLDNFYNQSGDVKPAYAVGFNAGTASDWTHLTYLIRVPELDKDGNAVPTSTVYAMIMGNATVGDCYYVDDFSVYEIMDGDVTLGFDTTAGTGGFIVNDNGIVNANSGFELGADGDVYDTVKSTQVNHIYAGNAHATITSEEAYKGKYSMKVASTGSGDPALNQLVTVKRGEVYEVSAYVKAAEGTTIAKDAIYIRLESGNYARRGSNYINAIANSDGWVKITTIYTAAADKLCDRLNINFAGGAGGTYYVDEFIVRRLGSEEGTVVDGNLVPQMLSDFELNGLADSTNITAGADALIDYTNKLVYSGQRALSIDKIGSGTDVKATIGGFGLTAGRTYRVSAWIGSCRITDALDTSVKFNVLGDDTTIAAKQSYAIRNTPKNNQTGKYFNQMYYTSFEFTAPSDTTNAALEIVPVYYNYTTVVDNLVIRDVTDEAGVSETYGNILTNGTFEGSHLDYSSVVTADGLSPQNGVAISYSDEYAHTGSHSLKVTQVTNDQSVIYYAKGEAGKQYKIGVWTRLDKDADPTTVDLRLYTPYEVKQESLSGASGWTYLEILEEAQDNGNVQFQIKANNKNNKLQSYYIDDVVVKEYNTNFAVEDTSFTYSADGAEYSAAGKNDIAAGTYKYTITVTNPTKNAVTVTPIIALYKADGSLVSADLNTYSVEPGSEQLDIPVTLAVASAEAGMYIKTFVWDSVDALKPVETPPVKVLIIGNSITKHGANPVIGWLGTWGMAATAAEKDYVHLLKAKAEAKTDNVELKWENISEFEKYFYDWNQFNASKYDEYVNFDADIIISTIGANIKNGANEGDPSYENDQIFAAKHYQDIVEHFNADGNAKIIVGLTTLTSTDNINIIKAAAEAKAWEVVDMSGLTAAEYLGGSNIAQGLESGAFNSLIESPEGAGVRSHPGDLGMAEMANLLWTPLEAAIDDVL